VTTFLIQGGHILAQNTPAQAAKSKGNSTLVTNGSDNGLLDVFIDPALGCTPWSANTLTNAAGTTPALALNEIQAAMNPGTTPALVPVTDPMVLDNNGAVSLQKTNLYRAAVGQTLAATVADADGTTYCKNFAIAGVFIQNNKALFTGLTTPMASAANNLYTFLAQRFAASLTNLNCLQLLNLAQPVTMTTDGNGVVTAANINTAQLQMILNGQTLTNSTSATNQSASATSATGKASSTAKASASATGKASSVVKASASASSKGSSVAASSATSASLPQKGASSVSSKAASASVSKTVSKTASLSGKVLSTTSSTASASVTASTPSTLSKVVKPSATASVSVPPAISSSLVAVASSTMAGISSSVAVSGSSGLAPSKIASATAAIPSCTSVVYQHLGNGLLNNTQTGQLYFPIPAEFAEFLVIL
jgi:hypothetical protein